MEIHRVDGNFELGLFDGTNISRGAWVAREFSN